MQLPLVLGHDGVALELIHRQLVRRRAGLLLLRLLLALLPCPPLLPLSSTGGCCALSSASLLNPATTPRCMRLKLLELNEGRRVGHHIGPALPSLCGQLGTKHTSIHTKALGTFTDPTAQNDRTNPLNNPTNLKTRDDPREKKLFASYGVLGPYARRLGGGRGVPHPPSPTPPSPYPGRRCGPREPPPPPPRRLDASPSTLVEVNGLN